MSSPAWRLGSRCTTPKPNRCKARAAPPPLPSTSAGQHLLRVEARLAEHHRRARRRPTVQ
eukprot:6642334-Pyramimonas_sp.AAC.1